MSDPFIAEIRMFAGNFAPRNWATCDGQILPISQNTALFSLIGTYYGGNGTTNFGLPNLQGAAPMGQGAGPGLTPRTNGEMVGTTTVTLTTPQMAIHTHQMTGAFQQSTSAPTANSVFGRSNPGNAYQTTTAHLTQMNPQMLTPIGGGQPHNNVQPYLAVTFIIALQGVFPPRQ